MFDRKKTKALAKQRLKKHYWIYVLLCLTAALIGTNYASELAVLSIYKEEETGVVENGKTAIDVEFNNILSNLASGNGLSNLQGLEDRSRERMQAESEKDRKLFGNHVEIGHSRGVLSFLYNEVSTGAFLVTLLTAMTKVIGSAGISVALMVICGMVVPLFVWIFGINVYRVVYSRMFLEGRIYDDLPVSRVTFLFRVRKWIKASLSMLRMSIYYNLWTFTIVGGFIKMFSYFAVPYIIAENPDINSKEAVLLSRKMMDGHKKECFILHLTFVGWDLLNICTLGLLGAFFLNPYKEAFYAEYYAWVREQAKVQKIELIDRLNDRYLYEKADPNLLVQVYDDLEELEEERIIVPEKKGFWGFLGKALGIVLYEDDQERERQEKHEKEIRVRLYDSILKGKAYPRRLFTMPDSEVTFSIKDEYFYDRRYSVWSMIMIFVTVSVLGWVWEVSLHLVSSGTFVNRGVLHGPWLPIYGGGGALILMALYRLRRRPPMQFLSIILLCGFVEYMTSWFLQETQGGKKWWDYSGYFLNVDGRICAEGLLVFGVGGMAIVYFLAPILDNAFRKLNRKKLIVISVALLSVFLVDQVYSIKHPNTGDGITNNKAGTAVYYVMEKWQH